MKNYEFKLKPKIPTNNQINYAGFSSIQYKRYRISFKLKSSQQLLNNITYCGNATCAFTNSILNPIPKSSFIPLFLMILTISICINILHVILYFKSALTHKQLCFL